MKYNLPSIGDIEIKNIVLDLNGTISLKGKLIDGVAERIQQLKNLGVDVFLLSGDQRGHGASIAKDLDIIFLKAASSKEKEESVKRLKSPKKTVAIGNARIDIGMFKMAALSIATLQVEGIHAGILPYIDIMVTNVNDALDLLLDENSLKATMKV